MNNSILSAIIICLFSCNGKTCVNNGVKTSLKLAFSAPDSGILVKKECTDFLMSNSLIDEESHWDIYENNDTIGRYFKIKKSGHFLVYINGIVVETKPDGTFVRGERLYGSGTYCYCLENEQDKFRKIGDYFCLTLCQTGSGYYACSFQLFKEYPNETPLTIPSGYSYMMGIRYQTLSSEMEFKDNNTLIMHYIAEEGDIVSESTDDENAYQTTSVNEFTVTYLFKNNKWETIESNKFDGLPIDL